MNGHCYVPIKVIYENACSLLSVSKIALKGKYHDTALLFYVRKSWEKEGLSWISPKKYSYRKYWAKVKSWIYMCKSNACMQFSFLRYPRPCILPFSIVMLYENIFSKITHILLSQWFICRRFWTLTKSLGSLFFTRLESFLLSSDSCQFIDIMILVLFLKVFLLCYT